MKLVLFRKKPTALTVVYIQQHVSSCHVAGMRLLSNQRISFLDLAQEFVATFDDIYMTV